MKELASIEIDDHVLWCDHNMPCAVCGNAHAIRQMNVGVFMPCEGCVNKGWQLRRFRPRSWWRVLLGLPPVAIHGPEARED